MADKDLDLDTENEGKSKTNLLIIVLIIVILAVGGGVAAMFLLGGDDEKSDSKDGHGGADAAHATPVNAPAIYSNMRPTFVINFEDTSKARYIQVDLVVMARQQHSIDLVQEYTPVLRNNIITILSGQNYEEINTKEGKEKLQGLLLKSINDTITAEVTNSPPPVTDDSEHPAPAHVPGSSYIEAVYFTSLVMQ